MKFQKLALAVMIAATLAGCKSGGSSDSNPVSTTPDSGTTTTPPVKVTSVGSFQDAATNGLYYVTSPSGQTGYTRRIERTGEPTTEGGYEFEAGDTVKFYLGGPQGLLLGEGAAQNVLMPQDIGNPETALTTARLLLSINSSNVDGIIEIPQTFKDLVLTNEEDKDAIMALKSIDLTIPAFFDDKSSGLSNALDVLRKIDPSISDIVDKSFAETHLSTTSEVIAEKTKDNPNAGAFDRSYQPDQTYSLR